MAIYHFITGQFLIQLVNIITSFMLLRWLSFEDYAQFSLTVGFQSTLGILVDLGFSGSIVALVGNRINNKDVIGQYIKSAKKFRNNLFWGACIFSLFVFPVFIHKHGWPWSTQIILLSCILSYLFFEGKVAFYTSPLLMHRRLNSYYRPKVLTALCKIAFIGILSILSALSSWAVAGVNSLVIALEGFLYKKSAADLIREPAHSNPKVNIEMYQYLSPQIPGIIFTAFQGQIALLIITWFGQTQNIAEVAALGRIGQIFLLLSAANTIMIGPYIAQLSAQLLIARYVQVLLVTLLIVSSLTFIAFVFPQPLLWILGPKYEHLDQEVGWIVLIASVGHISGVLWTIHSARKWIYWWGAFLYIGSLLLVQIVCITLMDLSTTLNILYFSLFTSLTVLVVHIVGGIYGFKHGLTRVKTELLVH